MRISDWSSDVYSSDLQTTPRKADDRRKAAFLAEWHSTLQILRDIGATVSLDANRPAWVDATASPGAQADQFLHAHYYHRTFDGRRSEEHTSELQSLMRISSAVFCLKQKNIQSLT